MTTECFGANQQRCNSREIMGELVTLGTPDLLSLDSYDEF